MLQICNIILKILRMHDKLQISQCNHKQPLLFFLVCLKKSYYE
jgi:hypothetical protein